MKRIGIISLYHQNKNYGGLLQAYALVSVLREMGADAKQISFERTSCKNPLVLPRKARLKNDPVGFVVNSATNTVKKAHLRYWTSMKDQAIQKELAQRDKSFVQFEDEIPHTEVVSHSTIVALNMEFDLFICGSDQIWNPDQLRDEYLLRFVAQGKGKMSYAASIGRDSLSERELQYISDALSTFDAISVRESLAQELLSQRIKLPVEWTLDPTLLLPQAEWDKVIQKYEIGGKYILAYFLGNSKEQRTAVKVFARAKGLKIVSFPHIAGHYRAVDAGFADLELYDVSPGQFIYLIQQAEYVITDSFHAAVFSIIYDKKFVVLERAVGSAKQKMNSRILSLLHMFGLDDRLVDPLHLSYVESPFCKETEEFEHRKSISMNFLRAAVEQPHTFGENQSHAKSIAEIRMDNVLCTYAACAKDDELRLSSSSGAIFSLLAESILCRNGSVYGVAMTHDCKSAEFIRIISREDLAKLRGSKYLQARVGNVYQQVRADLESGMQVLFSGTVCQVNGLKLFLGKDFENLYCVDVICHGTPSPKLWKEYVQFFEEQSNANMVSVNFRCKDDSWYDFGIKRVDSNHVSTYLSKDKDPFLLMFLRNYCLRPSCYKCVAKNHKRSDLTLADFWGINRVIPGMDDGKGVSLVIVRTEKGKAFFDCIAERTTYVTVNYEDGVRKNRADYSSTARPHERDHFFEDMSAMSFSDLARKYSVPTPIPIKQKIKKAIVKWIRKSLPSKLSQKK